MVHIFDPWQPEETPCEEVLACFLAYARLLGASLEARERGLPPRARPEPIVLLPEYSSGRVALWLLHQGHAEHLRPSDAAVTRTGIDMSESLLIREGSTFALTGLGEAFADALVGQMLFPEDERDFQHACAQVRIGRLTPRYDAEERALAWGGRVLKRFRQPSANQELVLHAAEELGWPAWFDDPLPRAAGINPKARLHDTIKCLNRHQNPPVIRFRGDGTGTRVGWAFA